MPLSSIEIDNNQEFEIEKVLDSRWCQFRLEYFIHWSGYNISECT